MKRFDSTLDDLKKLAEVANPLAGDWTEELIITTAKLCAEMWTPLEEEGQGLPLCAYTSIAAILSGELMKAVLEEIDDPERQTIMGAQFITILVKYLVTRVAEADDDTTG